MFYGQHLEDEYIKSLFPDGYIGICIEVGAYNGISLSNTYHFELIGWRCLCIEPIPSAYEECKKNRKESYNYCISDKNMDNIDFTIYHLGTNLCAISSLIPDERLVDSHNHLITDITKINVNVITLNKLLDDINFPLNIDFISIDTENTELDVLKGLDLNKYNVKILCIENNFNEPFIEEYLKNFGYRKINRIAVNDFYTK